MESMYKSIQYHSTQQVQEQAASWLACTGVYSIMTSVYRRHSNVTSMYKSIRYCGKHIQECSLMTSIYKSTDHHCKHVQEHTAL